MFRVERPRATTRFLVGAGLTAALATGTLTGGPAAFASPAAPTVAAVTAAPTVAAPAGSRKARKIARSLRKQVVALATSKLDAEYVWGGSGPDQFDCSGLVMWVYQQVTGVALPHYSGAQMDVTEGTTPYSKLRKGDLLFYGEDGSQHVTIYIGKRMQIGASSPRTGIVINSIDEPYYVSRYAGQGRVIRRPLSSLPIFQ